MQRWFFTQVWLQGMIPLAFGSVLFFARGACLLGGLWFGAVIFSRICIWLVSQLSLEVM